MNGADRKLLLAEAIMRDHSEGLHDEYDESDEGCTYPGCADAFWLVSKAIAENEGHRPW